MSKEAHLQELDCEVSVTLSANTTSINKAVFKNMEKTISEFMNLRKWTDDDYEPHQKIKCYLNINITDASMENAYIADVTLQSERPVFNSTYTTPLIRHKDAGLPFEYIENQPLDYADNNFISNLSASLAFYAYFIIAMENESFASKGGQKFLDKCNTICNLAPPNLTVAGTPVKGWQANQGMNITGQQTKVGMILALVGSSAERFRLANYRYHLEGIDLMESDPKKALDNIEFSLKEIYQIPSKHYVHKHFVLAKADEIINLYRDEPKVRRQKISEMVSAIEPAITGKMTKGFDL